MPLSIRTERALDRPDTQAIMWGPIALQTIGIPDNGSYWELSLYRFLKRDGNYENTAIKRMGSSTKGDPLFRTVSATNQTVNVQPYYISNGKAVSTYFRRVEPFVVFGSINTGVQNRKRNDGLPRYDVPVSGIVSPGTDGPTFLDLVWDQAPFLTHASFLQAIETLVNSFVTAGTYTQSEKDIILAYASKAEVELEPLKSSE